MSIVSILPPIASRSLNCSLPVLHRLLAGLLGIALTFIAASARAEVPGMPGVPLLDGVKDTFYAVWTPSTTGGAVDHYKIRYEYKNCKWAGEGYWHWHGTYHCWGDLNNGGGVPAASPYIGDWTHKASGGVYWPPAEGGTIWVQVKACNADGCSAWTPEQEVRTNTPPYPKLTRADGIHNGIGVQWQQRDPSIADPRLSGKLEGPAHWKVRWWRAGDPSNMSSVQIKKQHWRQYSITGLENGTKYKVQVASNNWWGDSQWTQPPREAYAGSVHTELRALQLTRAGDGREIPLDQKFAPQRSSYTASMPPSTSYVKVRMMPWQPAMKAELLGCAAGAATHCPFHKNEDGSFTRNIYLSKAVTVLRVTLVAGNRHRTKNYTLTLTREPAKLRNLQITTGEVLDIFPRGVESGDALALEPAFDADTRTYILRTAYNIKTVNMRIAANSVTRTLAVHDSARQLSAQALVHPQAGVAQAVESRGHAPATGGDMRRIRLTDVDGQSAPEYVVKIERDPLLPPAAPAAPALSAGVAQINARWTPPTLHARAPPVSNYYVRWRSSDGAWQNAGGDSDAGESAGDAHAYVIRGRLYFESYAVQIAAENEHGISAWSAATVSKAVQPPAPAAWVTTTGNAANPQLRVHWPLNSLHSELAFSETDAAIPYGAQIKSADAKWPAAALPQEDNLAAGITRAGEFAADSGGNSGSILFSGFTPGATYDVRAFYIYRDRATARDVAGPFSARSRFAMHLPPVTPQLFVDADDASLALTWQLPANTPPHLIDSYTLRWRALDAGILAAETVFVPPSKTQHTITGLQNRRAYFVEAAAVNAFGSGGWASQTATPFGKPAAPGEVRAQSDDGALQVTWNAPHEVSGEAITGYRIRWADAAAPQSYLNPGGAAGYAHEETETHAAIAGLQNRVTYAVEVAAVTAFGMGAFSDAISGTPAAPFRFALAPKFTWAPPLAWAQPFAILQPQAQTSPPPQRIAQNAAQQNAAQQSGAPARSVVRLHSGEIAPLILPEPTGGLLPYAYQVDALPPGLQFDSATRAITGSAQVGASTLTYIASDAANREIRIAFDLEVRARPSVSAPSVTYTIGEQAETVLPEAAGGFPPYTYALSGLPGGFTFAAAARTITGMARAAGTVTATYAARDSTALASGHAAKTFRITLRQGNILPPPDELVAARDDAALQLTWRAPPAGAAPILGYRVRHAKRGAAWVDALGAATGGAHTAFRLAALDNAVEYAVQVAAVNAHGIGLWSESAFATPAAALTIARIADAQFHVEAAREIALPAAAGGIAPYRYTLTTPPRGLLFDAGARTLSGAPLQAALHTLTYRATDAEQHTAEQTFRVQSRAQPSLPPPQIAGAQGGVLFDMQLPAAAGGFPPYSYSLSGLPNALTFDAAARRAGGMPKVAGEFALVYAAQDGSGFASARATHTFLLQVSIDLNVAADDQTIDAKDGIIIARYLLGVRGESLTAGQSMQPPAEVESRLAVAQNAAEMDIDADGKRGMVDGILLARYLLGLRGETLTAGIAEGKAKLVEQNIRALLGG